MIFSPGAKHLAAALADPAGANLESLIVGGNHVGDDGAMYLADALEPMFVLPPSYNEFF